MPTPDLETFTQRSSQPRISGRGIRHRKPKQRPKKAVLCPECKSDKVETSDGNTVCTNCGTSINESNIVSEVQFGENAAGAAVVQGAFVGEGQRHAGGDGTRFGTQRESREVSEANGREEIRKQASWHQLPDHIFDQAFNLYKMAIAHQFIKGRMISVVAAVCLYGACRRARNSEHAMLLIDFAEGIAINVFKLGQTWQDLKKLARLEDIDRVRPIVDVEELVNRFVKKLEFGRDWQKVANDTLLLLRRMKRDWMVTGRRPNGLIGACIILAARMNNYRRTVREVVYITKVADITVAKRLEEFQRTPASTMTVEEFRGFGQRLKQGVPPAIYERQEREARQRLIDEAMSEDGADERPILNLSEVAPLYRTPSSTPRSTATPEASQRSTASPTPFATPQPHRRDADGFAIPDIPVDPALLADHASPDGTDPALAKLISRDRRNTSSTPGDLEDDQTPGPDTPRRRGPKKGSRRTIAAIPWSQDDLISEEQLGEEMQAILEDPQIVDQAEESRVTISEGGEERSRQLAASLRRAMSLEPTAVPEDPEIGDHEFDNDPEVLNCLLSPDEQRIKEKIWVTHNEDWLRSQQAKMLKKTLDEAQGKPTEKDPNKKKRKRASRMGDGSLLRGRSVESPAEAVQAMMEKHAKHPSKHLNYEAIRKLFPTEGSSSSGGPTSRAGSVASMSQPRDVRGASRESAIELDDDDQEVAATPSRRDVIDLSQDEDMRSTPARPTPDRPTVTRGGLTTPDQTQRITHAAQEVVRNAVSRGISVQSMAEEGSRPATPTSTRKRRADDDDTVGGADETEEPGDVHGPWDEDMEDEEEDDEEDDVADAIGGGFADDFQFDDEDSVGQSDVDDG